MTNGVGSNLHPGLAQGNHLISDYTFEKDALFAGINLTGDELAMYQRVHEALAEKMIPPALVVYLRASTATLMQRIALRDRPYERNMEVDYIAELNQAYDAFYLTAERKVPVLVLESDQFDFVRNPEDLDWIENRIRQALKLAPFQPELLNLDAQSTS